jgi:hypothetical protein
LKNFVKIAIISNEVQAQYLSALLKVREVPHLIQSYHDTAYDGIFQSMKGWGHIEAPEEFKEEILEMMKEIDDAPLDESK